MIRDLKALFKFVQKNEVIWQLGREMCLEVCIYKSDNSHFNYTSSIKITNSSEKRSKVFVFFKLNCEYVDCIYLKRKSCVCKYIKKDLKQKILE